jgi:peptidoglycan/LPS O-acetylase OafA/YrhL
MAARQQSGYMPGATKHFETLDALRGVAAIAVVLGHFDSYHSLALFPKSYLAVDFFFILSGVVIARAYEERLLRGGAMDFMKRRIIRLYPLVVLAMMFGLVTEASKTLIAHSSSAIPLGALPGEWACGILLLPYLGGPVWASVFPFDTPLWSLFFEVTVNAFYAFAVRILTTRRLLFFIIAASLWLFWFDVQDGTIHAGWYLSSLLIGLARVMFSFPLGVLLYRLYARGWFNGMPRVSGLWLALALVLLFSPGEHFLGVWYDPVCVMLFFPMIVVAGCFDGLPARVVPVAALLGRLSYPVYVLHWPTVYRNGYHLIAKTHGAMLGLACVFDIAAICLIAWLAAKFFDEPVRRYLTRRFLLPPPLAPATLEERPAF